MSTHNGSGRRRHDAVEDERRDEAALLRSGVRLHQVCIITEEALDMDPKRVGAFKVVRQQHCPGHDDQLERQQRNKLNRSVSRDLSPFRQHFSKIGLISGRKTSCKQLCPSVFLFALGPLGSHICIRFHFQ